jgi:hypothetical protein
VDRLCPGGHRRSARAGARRGRRCSRLRPGARPTRSVVSCPPAWPRERPDAQRQRRGSRGDEPRLARSHCDRAVRMACRLVRPRACDAPRPAIRVPRAPAAEGGACAVEYTSNRARSADERPSVTESDWRAAVVDERVQLVREVARDRYQRLELNALVQRVVVTDDRWKAANELASRWSS